MRKRSISGAITPSIETVADMAVLGRAIGLPVVVRGDILRDLENKHARRRRFCILHESEMSRRDVRYELQCGEVAADIGNRVVTCAAAEGVVAVNIVGCAVIDDGVAAIGVTAEARITHNIPRRTVVSDNIVSCAIGGTAVT